jgi:transposase
VLSVQNIMVRKTGSRCSVKRMRELTTKELKHLLPEASQVLAITSSLAILDCLSQQLKTLEKAVSKRLQHPPSYEQLLTVDGIGTIFAQTIALETGQIGRFPPVGDSASSCRCVNSTKLSNGKRKGQGNVKNGHLYLGWASMEAAQFAIRFNPQAQRFYQRKLAKSTNNTVLARQSVAHKLSRACYYLMRDLVPFEATKACG